MAATEQEKENKKIAEYINRVYDRVKSFNKKQFQKVSDEDADSDSTSQEELKLAIWQDLMASDCDDNERAELEALYLMIFNACDSDEKLLTVDWYSSNAIVESDLKDSLYTTVKRHLNDRATKDPLVEQKKTVSTPKQAVETPAATTQELYRYALNVQKFLKYLLGEGLAGKDEIKMALDNNALFKGVSDKQKQALAEHYSAVGTVVVNFLLMDKAQQTPQESRNMIGEVRELSKNYLNDTNRLYSQESDHIQAVIKNQKIPSSPELDEWEHKSLSQTPSTTQSNNSQSESSKRDSQSTRVSTSSQISGTTKTNNSQNRSSKSDSTNVSIPSNKDSWDMSLLDLADLQNSRKNSQNLDETKDSQKASLKDSQKNKLNK